METLRFHGETEFVGYFSFEFIDFLALEFNDSVTILADDVIVIRMIRIVWIVKLVVLPEIHFANQAAFG